MAQYINKNALVAEIERRRDLHHKYYMKSGVDFISECKYDEDKYILSFLDTLEVKEVDLDDVIENYIHENFGERWDGCVPVGCFELDSMAEHFFELGLKAKKGE